MNCPACGRALKERTIGAIAVDVCDGGCAGLWFDPFELDQFDEPFESAGEELLEVARGLGVTVDHAKRLDCPRCTDSVLMRHFWSVKQDVEVDECPTCGGFWLHAGELGRIRAMFASEQERKDAARDYFQKAIAPELTRMRAEGAAKLAAARKITWLFRFLCPSYYIPGDQDGGAF